MIVTIDMTVTGADRRASYALAPVSVFLTPLFIQSKYTICFTPQWAHTVAAGPWVHPSMYTDSPLERNPLERQQKSFHKPKTAPPTHTHTPLPYNSITVLTTTESKHGGACNTARAASTNISKREGNPGPDQLLLQKSMKKHQLFFLVFSIFLRASWLDKLSRYCVINSGCYSLGNVEIN